MAPKIFNMTTLQCPDGCDCYHDADWTMNIVSCSAREHRRIPILIPLDATTVRLDGNDFGRAAIDTQVSRV